MPLRAMALEGRSAMIERFGRTSSATAIWCCRASCRRGSATRCARAWRRCWKPSSPPRSPPSSRPASSATPRIATFSNPATRSASSSRRRRSTPDGRLEAGQGALDQQGRPCAARPRPGLRALLAPAGARRAGGRPRHRRALAAAVDVHLQAAADRRRGRLPPGCELPDDRAGQRRGPVVCARGRHDPERLPVCRTGRSQGAAALPLRPPRYRRARTIGPRWSRWMRRRCRAKGWCRSRCQRVRWWSCTASCRMAARPIARRARATPTRCTSSTAGAPGGRTTGCSVRRTCRCAVSDRAGRPCSRQRARRHCNRPAEVPIPHQQASTEEGPGMLRTASAADGSAGDHGGHADDIIYPSAIPFVLVHLACFAAVWTGVTAEALAARHRGLRRAHVRGHRGLPPLFRAPHLPDQPDRAVSPRLPGADLGAARRAVVGGEPPGASSPRRHPGRCPLATPARLPARPCRLDLHAAPYADRLRGRSPTSPAIPSWCGSTGSPICRRRCWPSRCG